ncbi:hypothetical protein LIER_07560 [Lithospermum erythrorhizon]|uniref:Endonuclease/exonuclease/phosphatase domain-containing protein n=1 Tax=Lithospermum erythrorhizon TaxID=34254 RepID=A0AAV3P9Y6_LITER
MNTLEWNYLGLGQPRAVRALHHLIKTNKPSRVFLMETKLRNQECGLDQVKIEVAECFLSGYARTFRRHSWKLLKFINNNSDLPTSFLGDFNEVLDVGEYSSSRRVRPWWQTNNFKRVVVDCELIDIGFSGHPFTWCNNFFSSYTKRACLHRCLVGKNWKVLFPERSISYLTSTHSDHLALLLKCGKKQDLGSQKRRFRFEDGWCLYEESKQMVEKA